MQEEKNTQSSPTNEDQQIKRPSTLEEQERASTDIFDGVKDIKAGIQAKDYDAYDLKFMSSLSEAVLAKAPSTSKKILYALSFTIFWLIVWASWAQIDEITRGSGKIIPSGKNQAIQNLEGGIVDAIFVKEAN